MLLEKLNHYGIRGIANDWFSSYLSDRTQFVSINGFNSDYKNVKYVNCKNLCSKHCIILLQKKAIRINSFA